MKQSCHCYHKSSMCVHEKKERDENDCMQANASKRKHYEHLRINLSVRKHNNHEKQKASIITIKTSEGSENIFLFEYICISLFIRMKCKTQVV